MTYFNLIRTTVFAGTLAFFAIAKANEIENLPSDFTRNFSVSKKGVITPLGSSPVLDAKFTIDSNAGSPRVYSKSSGTTAWHVGSAPCVQNKQFNCLSVYTRNSSKIRGNQMNPLAAEDHQGNYSLYRVNKDTGILSSVINCKSKYTVNTTVDESSLKDCHEYTQKKCTDWSNFILNESGLVNGEIEKARECTDLVKRIDKAQLKASQIFQSDLKESEKDLKSQFEDSTRGDKNLRIAAGVKVMNSKSNPALSQYEHLVERSNDCAANTAWFEKGTLNTDYLKGLFDSTQTTEPAKSSQSGSSSKVQKSNGAQGKTSQ